MSQPHPRVRDRSARLLGSARIASALVGALGLILVVGASPGTGTLSWTTDLVGPGATLAAAGLATFVALLGIKTYQDQKRDQADATTLQARSRVYEHILAHVVRSMIGGAPLADEPIVRAQAAVWASPPTLQALADWFRYAVEHSGKAMTLAERGPTFEVVHRLVAAMREDLYPGSVVSQDDVLRMMYNDYIPLVHNPANISAMKVLEDGRTDWKPPAAKQLDGH